MPESSNITKADIDREREVLTENVREHPALGLLIEDLPDDYDPNEPIDERDDDA